MDKYKISELKQVGVDGVAGLIVKLFKETPYNEKWSKSNSRIRVLDCLKHPRSVYWKLEINSKLAGFIISYNIINYDGFYNYVDYLGIDQKYQGKGFGKKLVEYHQKYLRRNKVKALFYFGYLKSRSWRFHTKTIGLKEDEWKLLIKKFD